MEKKTMKAPDVAMSPTMNNDRLERTRHLLRDIAKRAERLAVTLGEKGSPISDEDHEIIRLVKIPMIRQLQREQLFAFAAGDVTFAEEVSDRIAEEMAF